MEGWENRKAYNKRLDNRKTTSAHHSSFSPTASEKKGNRGQNLARILTLSLIMDLAKKEASRWKGKTKKKVYNKRLEDGKATHAHFSSFSPAVSRQKGNCGGNVEALKIKTYGSCFRFWLLDSSTLPDTGSCKEWPVEGWENKKVYNRRLEDEKGTSAHLSSFSPAVSTQKDYALLTKTTWRKSW